MQRERFEGLPLEEAIYDVCVLRFRPIMMTMTAALPGTLPIAIGISTRKHKGPEAPLPALPAHSTGKAA